MEVKSNRKNTSKNAKANPGDILSDLPDEILSHILSFLPPEYAVRTSILSPRWKDVYKGVPNIKSFINKYLLILALSEKVATLWVKVMELQVSLRELQVFMRGMQEYLEKLGYLEALGESDDDDDEEEEDEEEEDDDDEEEDDDDDDDEGSESESE